MYVATLALALLTSEFREAGVTPRSHEIDFLEVCPSVIASHLPLCSPTNHGIILKG